MRFVAYKHENGAEFGNRPEVGKPIRTWDGEVESSGYFRYWEYEGGIVERRWIPARGYKSIIEIWTVPLL